MNYTAADAAADFNRNKLEAQLASNLGTIKMASRSGNTEVHVSGGVNPSQMKAELEKLGFTK